MWGDDISRSTVLMKQHLGDVDSSPEVRVGMTKDQVREVMADPSKVFTMKDGREVWVYYTSGLRWFIALPIYLPIGRNHYKFIFSGPALQEILLETTEYF